MSVMIEEGGYYENTLGQVEGPMRPFRSRDYPWVTPNGKTYTVDGLYYGHGHENASPNDLVKEVTPPAEQKPGPVRTVTRKEIVPGKYGLVRVYNDGNVYVNMSKSKSRIAAAIETLIKIRDAMEDDE